MKKWGIIFLKRIATLPFLKYCGPNVNLSKSSSPCLATLCFHFQKKPTYDGVKLESKSSSCDLPQNLLFLLFIYSVTIDFGFAHCPFQHNRNFKVSLSI